MRFFIISKTILILIIPFLIFLGAANLVVFDKPYYAGKLSEYKIGIPDANSANEMTIDFISGKNDKLPDVYSEREKQHLLDLKHAIRTSAIMLHILIFLFILLLIASIFTLKASSLVKNFAGKILIFGGFLTILLSAILFLLVNYNFSSAFESFHSLIFKKGTYTFDPEKEIIVRLYPEQLFMDLGLRISKLAIISSIIIILLGFILLLYQKTKRIKNRK